MADFAIAHRLTSANEGGLANSAADRGKLTYRGITTAFFPQWAGWPIVRKALQYCGWDLGLANKQLAANAGLQAMVDAFYKTNFWDVYSLDKVTNQAIANELFDTGVNMGVPIEARFLQIALNVTNINQRTYSDLIVDGVIGAKTIAVLNAHPNKMLVLKLLNIQQGARYINIMLKDPTQEIFCASWFSRVAI